VLRADVVLPQSEQAACCQDASAFPAAAVAALLAPVSPLSLARQRFGDGPPAAPAAARVYDVLLSHPAAAARAAAAAAVLADLRYWAAQAATDLAMHPEPQEAAVHSPAEDAREGPTPSEPSSSDPRDEDEPAQHEPSSAAQGGGRAAAGSRKQEPGASGQPAQQLSPAQVSHPPCLQCWQQRILAYVLCSCMSIVWIAF
jgi:hypothetical protein